MFKSKFRTLSIVATTLIAASSTPVFAQNALDTVTLLNCGYTKDTGSSRIDGTRSAGHMSVWHANCSSEQKFDYQKKLTIILSANGVKASHRIGSSHDGCSTNNSKAKISDKVVWNKSSNYMLVHRNNVKSKTYAVAIPKTVGLDCGHLWSKTPLFTRYQEIK